MTTASTTAILSSSSVANYNAWVTEVITALFTSVGLTQTADTGQTTNGGSSVPGVSTAGGYVIGRFNDAAQGTSPVFFKLEFGTGATSPQPNMWITVGQGSNGSGTLTGTLSTRASVFTDANVVSGSTSYVSRFVWNATAGFFGMVFKIGAVSANDAYGSIFIFRDNNASGASTTNSVTLITSALTAAQISTSVGSVQTYSYLTATMLTLPDAAPTNALWTFWPFALTTTTYGSQVQVAPCIFATPVLYISACLCVALISEIPIGNTVSMALVGSGSNTYLAVGLPFGGNVGPGGCGNLTVGLLMLWQ